MEFTELKNVADMTYTELKEEIKYIVSLLDEQPFQHEAYLADLSEQLAKKANEEA